MNQEYSHAITLFDDLEDDLYDGELGFDDDDFPSVRLTYHLSSGKTTKNTEINKRIDQLEKQVSQEKKSVPKRAAAKAPQP